MKSVLKELLLTVIVFLIVNHTFIPISTSQNYNEAYIVSLNLVFNDFSNLGRNIHFFH